VVFYNKGWIVLESGLIIISLHDITIISSPPFIEQEAAHNYMQVKVKYTLMKP